MARVVLVHGMAATKRSWSDLPRRLKAGGHDVANITLPGHGSFFEYWTTDLSDYVDEVAEALLSTEKSVLIGHSMGGFVISQTAAQHVAQISGLIYVAAMMPRPGDTIKDLSAVAGTDVTDLLDEFTQAGVGADVLVPQPLRPLNAPFEDTQGISSVPRHYVHCSEDRIIPPALQSSMTSAWPGTTLVNISTGHLPQYTEPDLLEREILAVLP
ncbi:alpha/beta fold hydrolase [Ruegeria jejuensis]|uniref:alpha/beta fold hydrolase n=1 Tax=Ruegeria jejuensis TaxID=3233338 RepID=UPI00355C25E5